MKSHCPGCHGHVYDEYSDFDSCAEHGMDDERPDCPGCQECERVRAEVLSVRESLQRERAGQVKCNSGHVSDRALWDCPVCVEVMRDRLAKAELVIRAIREHEQALTALANTYTDEQLQKWGEEMKKACGELEKAKKAWEEADG